VPDFLLTVILATILVALCLTALGIGQLLTGKSKLRGSCGGMKKFIQEQSGSSDCPICGADKKKSCSEKEKASD
jgi:hypothetical protein